MDRRRKLYLTPERNGYIYERPSLSYAAVLPAAGIKRPALGTREGRSATYSGENPTALFRQLKILPRISELAAFKNDAGEDQLR